MDESGATPPGTSKLPPTVPPTPVRRSALRIVLVISIAIALVALAVAWTVTPLGGTLDPRKFAGHARQVRDWPLAPLVVIAVFVASGLVSVPATAMIGATALLFGAWLGSFYALAGMMTSAVVVFAIGRFAARDMVDEWLARRVGSTLASLNRRLERRGLVTIALIRLTPVPFSIQNLVAGASRIGFVDFLVGTSVGILPAITLMATLATGLDAWLASPDWGRMIALIASAVVVVGIGWALRSWAARQEADR